MPRSDGLSDGYNTIQGTRSYDSSVGNWTTPDAYAGDVRDPMSQKSYVWNGNNPVSYSDPSGYDSLWIGYSVAFVGIATIYGIPALVIAYHAFAVLEDDGGNIVRTYAYGPQGHFLNNHYDDAGTASNAKADEGNKSLTEAASCGGGKGDRTICSWEGPFNSVYDHWPNNRIPYLGINLNSNTALSFNLAAGGLGQSSPPGAPGWVPGWDNSVSGHAMHVLIANATLEESEGLGGADDSMQNAIGGGQCRC
jgi:RHS repeat-associated protein